MLKQSMTYSIWFFQITDQEKEKKLAVLVHQLLTKSCIFVQQNVYIYFMQYMHQPDPNKMIPASEHFLFSSVNWLKRFKSL